MAVTGEALWLALTAQGHEVSIEDCKKIAHFAGTLGLWVCVRRGAYTNDRHQAQELVRYFYGEGAWLIRDGEIQVVAHDLLPHLVAAMYRNGNI